MEHRSTCLLVNDAEIFPEFHHNLLAICAECGLAVRALTNANALVNEISRHNGDLALVIIDLELLKAIAPADELAFRHWIQAGTVPVVGLGYHEDEATAESRRNRIRHCLVKYQEPSQILSVIRAVTYSARRQGRRRHPRYLVDLTATFRRGAESCQAQVQNLSLGGMFLKTFFTLEPGTEIELEFRLGDSGETISCSGRVRHSHCKRLGDTSPEAAGIGVEFSPLPEAAMKKLQTFLDGRLALSDGEPEAKQ
jgi:hypothetical protein